jgi:hypothetical protein
MCTIDCFSELEEKFVIHTKFTNDSPTEQKTLEGISLIKVGLIATDIENGSVLVLFPSVTGIDIQCHASINAIYNDEDAAMRQVSLICFKNSVTAEKIYEITFGKLTPEKYIWHIDYLIHYLPEKLI